MALACMPDGAQGDRLSCLHPARCGNCLSGRLDWLLYLFEGRRRFEKSCNLSESVSRGILYILG